MNREKKKAFTRNSLGGQSKRLHVGNFPIILFSNYNKYWRKTQNEKFE